MLVRAENIGDQFMYGPAFLVNPVTEPAANTRRLYLPKARWYDFWSGTSTDGGQIVDGTAPLERMPLYIRAGSMVPMGPERSWSRQVAVATPSASIRSLVSSPTHSPSGSRARYMVMSALM